MSYLKKVFRGLLVVVAILSAILAWRSIGPYRSYRLDFVKAPPAPPKQELLKVGVAKRDITPTLDFYDTYQDVDSNNLYEPAKGDTYTDRNGNGRFDAVWLAGFGNNRPAKGVHDPLWVRAIAFENNGVRVVWATVDSIGIFHEKILEMRHRLNPSLHIDHFMVSCLHNHEAPDTMGIWSVGLEKPYYRFDKAYMDFVIRMCAEAAEEAVQNLRPVETYLVSFEAGPDGFVDDSRLPLVYDNTVYCARFVEPGTEKTVATLVEWGNHVETLGSRNPLITSDFAHYWREGVENGVPDPNGMPGLGGMCLYFQGQVGGLMTQLHTTVPDRNGKDKYAEASFEKAQALGENLALLTLAALRSPNVKKMEDQRVAVAAKTVYVKAKPLFSLGVLLGLVHPGWYWGKVRSEVNAFRIGEIEVLTVPGELYPEIGNGGVEAPAGQDFAIPPQEVPPLRSQMRGTLNMIIGLANDELGYIIPKSQWDTRPPYAYGKEKPQYGEVNSFGPEVAPTLHREMLGILDRLHAAIGS